MTMIEGKPPKGHRLLVLATSNQRTVLEQLDVTESFNSELAVPNVNNHAELQYVLAQSETFGNPAAAIQELGELTRSDSVSVSISQVLTAIESARQDEDPESKFAQVIAAVMAKTRN